MYIYIYVYIYIWFCIYIYYVYYSCRSKPWFSSAWSVNSQLSPNKYGMNQLCLNKASCFRNRRTSEKKKSTLCQGSVLLLHHRSNEHLQDSKIWIGKLEYFTNLNSSAIWGWFPLHSPSSMGFGHHVRSWWNFPRFFGEWSPIDSRGPGSWAQTQLWTLVPRATQLGGEGDLWSFYDWGMVKMMAFPCFSHMTQIQIPSGNLWHSHWKWPSRNSEVVPWKAWWIFVK